MQNVSKFAVQARNSEEKKGIVYIAEEGRRNYGRKAFYNFLVGLFFLAMAFLALMYLRGGESTEESSIRNLLMFIMGMFSVAGLTALIRSIKNINTYIKFVFPFDVG